MHFLVSVNEIRMSCMMLWVHANGKTQHAVRTRPCIFSSKYDNLKCIAIHNITHKQLSTQQRRRTLKFTV